MRTPTRQALRVVSIAAVVWAAAAASVLLPRSAAAIAAGLWAASGVCLCLLVRSPPRRRRGRILVVVVAALALAASAASQSALAQPAREAALALPLSGGRAVTAVVVVEGKVEPFGGDRWAFDARALSIDIGPDRHDLVVPVTVRIARDARPDGLDVGARAVVRATGREADAGRRAVLDLAASEIRLTEPAQGALGVASALRTTLARESATLPGAGAELIPGLAVGDTSAVSAQLDAAMKLSSLAHLTAVSGANCALVVGVAAQLAAVAGAGRRTRIAVGIAVLAGFVLLVTPEPSVVRAAVMAAIAMSAVLLGRRVAGLAVLSLATAVILVVDPWLSLSLGFALSACATAALLVLTRPLTAGLARFLPRSLALVIAVPLAAQLACGPLLVLVAPAVPVQGVVANLLAGPAAPAATVLGLLACLSAPVAVLQAGFTALAWIPAAWIAATAATMAELPGALIPWVGGWTGAALLALVSAAVVIAILPASGPAGGRLRRLTVLSLAVLLGVASGASALRTVVAPLTLPADWSVLACDVGQGDAVLLRSRGVVALVDTGPDAASLRTCLSQAGIDRIALLVLTHYDADHVGGIDAVSGRVGTVLHGPTADAGDRAVLERLRAGGADIVAAARGVQGELGGARWQVLWPPVRSAAFPHGNDASVTLEIGGGGVPRTLLLGDLSAAPQAALRRSGALAPRYDVVKVAHHGSADQDPGLYAALGAAVGIVSVGAGNDYGHPRAETLDLLTANGIRILRTDRSGRVAIWLSSSGLALWRERAEPAGPAGRRRRPSVG